MTRTVLPAPTNVAENPGMQTEPPPHLEPASHTPLSSTPPLPSPMHFCTVAQEIPTASSPIPDPVLTSSPLPAKRMKPVSKAKINHAASNLMFKFRQSGIKHQTGEVVSLDDKQVDEAAGHVGVRNGLTKS